MASCVKNIYSHVECGMHEFCLVLDGMPHVLAELSCTTSAQAQYGSFHSCFTERSLYQFMKLLNLHFFHEECLPIPTQFLNAFPNIIKGKMLTLFVR